MLYVQLKSRAVITLGEELGLGDMALITNQKGEPQAALSALKMPCPKREGVWRFPTIALLNALKDCKEQVTLLGADECLVHVVPLDKRNHTNALRACLAFILLFFGSALAIAWFHADVNMLDAQRQIYRLLCGQEVENTLLLVIPYAVGVGLGVAVFYSLIGKKKTVSPLDIQLDQYRKDAEQTASQTP